MPWNTSLGFLKHGIVFIVVTLLQWLLDLTVGWLSPWYWPLVSAYFFLLFRFRSAYFIFFFYLFHFYFSFDTTRTGTTCTLISCNHGDLVLCQERIEEYLTVGAFDNRGTGMDQIFGAYRNVGIFLFVEKEMYLYWKSGNYFRFYRPRIFDGENPEEFVIHFCPGYQLTIYPDFSFVETRGKEIRKGSLTKWKTTDDDQARISKSKPEFIRQIISKDPSPGNWVSYFLIHWISPIFCLFYWVSPRLRAQFNGLGWANLIAASMIFIFYLNTGIPRPASWPLLIILLGWIKNLKLDSKPLGYFAHIYCAFILFFTLYYFASGLHIDIFEL